MPNLFNFLFTRKLSSVLEQTFHVKVHGVKFELRKLNPLDYMNGSKAITKSFDTYKSGSDKSLGDDVNVIKIKEHYVDVFMGSVVTPKLTRSKEAKDEGIWVENLLVDWDLATDLYGKIMEITYGKKKLKSFSSPKKK